MEFSCWATPIVPIPKRDGTFRICGDFKVTLNPALQVDQHPIPKPEDIFASLAGGKLFTTLDLSQAYQQLMLDEESKELITISTHLGVVSLQPTSFWSGLGTRNFSMDNGITATWTARSQMLSRRYHYWGATTGSPTPTWTGCWKGYVTKVCVSRRASVTVCSRPWSIWVMFSTQMECTLLPVRGEPLQRLEHPATSQNCVHSLA